MQNLGNDLWGLLESGARLTGLSVAQIQRGWQTDAEAAAAANKSAGLNVNGHSGIPDVQELARYGYPPKPGGVLPMARDPALGYNHVLVATVGGGLVALVLYKAFRPEG
jgi:hypothetical protein